MDVGYWSKMAHVGTDEKERNCDDLIDENNFGNLFQILLKIDVMLWNEMIHYYLPNVPEIKGLVCAWLHFVLAHEFGLVSDVHVDKNTG